MSEVETWARTIPKIERQQPLIVADGYAFSPDAALREIESGTDIGRKLEQKIIARDFTDIKDEYALAVERLRERLSKLPESMSIVSVAGAQYTASDALNEVEAGTRIGRALIDAEVTRISEVLQKRR
jgi:hypothetical protein